MHYADGAHTKCLDVLPEEMATCSDLNTTAFQWRMIKQEHPDLVVFTGTVLELSELQSCRNLARYVGLTIINPVILLRKFAWP